MFLVWRKTLFTSFYALETVEKYNNVSSEKYWTQGYYKELYKFLKHSDILYIQKIRWSTVTLNGTKQKQTTRNVRQLKYSNQ